MSVKKLEGKNIYLGPLQKKDLEKYLKWLHDMDVHKFTDQPSKLMTLEDEEEWYDRARKNKNSWHFAIYLKNEAIGVCGISNFDRIDRTAVIGISIGEKKHWNKGYGTEAIKLLLDYGFNILNLNNIMLTVKDFNERARRCYEKAGFKEFGRRRKSEYFGGEYHDAVYMDILKEEFEK